MPVEQDEPDSDDQARAAVGSGGLRPFGFPYVPRNRLPHRPARVLVPTSLAPLGSVSYRVSPGPGRAGGAERRLPPDPGEPLLPLELFSRHEPRRSGAVSVLTCTGPDWDGERRESALDGSLAASAPRQAHEQRVAAAPNHHPVLFGRFSMVRTTEMGGGTTAAAPLSLDKPSCGCGGTVIQLASPGSSRGRSGLRSQQQAPYD